ncbi:iron siderophore-binding protein [Thalassobacillus devorans]|uniref:Iron siderophore-binding protein n=1 Tax=Thalassobacillus devorans TaxID=279813 RepID=A0ABQ1PG95_9BACI|nr:iron-siderophore ABC transporter substrate-binding protein [Thalassobacillus devorans]NIK29437.1 iron complex transport system substrate-binding protein [Thalassobacillus devorans]GGC96685.1 iron siderophore-binding protein [Thalassobacillus devorans]
MSKKYLPAFILMLVLSLVLAACGGSSSEDTSDEQEQNNEDSSSSEDFEPYTIEHAMGETTIEEKPERVVILTNEGTEALLALGVQPVGAVKSWLGDPWYDHISDQMEGVEVVGDESNVNIEKILELQPDLIIGNKMRQEDIYDKLSKIAPTVFAETLRGEWQENFMTYSKALNKEEEGQQLIEEYDQRLEDFADQAGDKLDQEVSVVRFMPDHVRIMHKDSFSGVILDQIGFNRPESQQAEDFMEKATKERIPAMDGDILFHFTYETGDGAAKEVQQEWLQDPLFKNLEVVKSGEVHEVSDATWNTAGGYLAANEMVNDLEKIFLEEEE